MFLIKGNKLETVFICVDFSGCISKAFDNKAIDSVMFIIFFIIIVSERLIADVGYTVRNCYDCKSGTTTECIIANACHAVRDYYTRQSGAILKRRLTNACHTIWDCYTCQFGAAVECIIVNTTHAIRNYYTCKSGTTIERRAGYSLCSGFYCYACITWHFSFILIINLSDINITVRL